MKLMRLGVWRGGVLIWLATAGGAASGALTEQAQRNDGQRVSLMVYEPSQSPCLPLAIVSHGAGGSEAGYSYLGEGLQAQGWRVVVVGHAQSGRRSLIAHMRREGFKEGLASTAQDAPALADRMLDIQATLTWMNSRCAPPLKLPRRILVGHSMGATTVHLEAGARNSVGVQGEDRFDAYIALSPQGVGTVFPREAWSDIRKPFLQITGSEDTALEGGPETRRQPFENMPPGCHWFAVIDGATHMNFAGRGRSSRVEALTLGLMVDFLKATPPSPSGDCVAPVAPKGMTLHTK